MKLGKHISTAFWMFIGIIGLLLASCSGDPSSSGVEYMPDMYRSPAIEAYVDYGVIADVEDPALTKKLSAKLPPAGTIPFHEAEEEVAIYMPYPFKKEEYDLAGATWRSPLPYTKENIEEGKYIYERFCTHCHGEDGGGNGSLIQTGKYPSPGTYASKQITEGHMYHTITYGKGQMGSHASQIDPLERWQVIQYVKQLKNGGEYPVEDLAIKLDSSTTNLVLDDIYFSTGSAALNKRKSRKGLNALITYMSLFDTKEIELAGHTDNTGDEEKNITLSLERAESVKKYITARGVEASRVTTKGYGSSSPIASNTSDEGKAQNRRTEVNLLN